MRRLALTKDGKLTYCTASEENIGKGRCNHIDHQKNKESIKDFTIRCSQLTNKNISMLNIPSEIRCLNNGLLKLDEKLKERNLNLSIKSVGGYATYHITDLPTMDIYSFEKINDEVKNLIHEIALESDELELDWLNDEILNLQNFGSHMTRNMNKYILKNINNSFINDNRLSELENIDLKIAKSEIILGFKIADICKRSKEKDLDDLKRIIKYEKWTPNDIWNYCKKFNFDKIIEKEDLAIDLFQMQILNENNYINFIGEI